MVVNLSELKLNKKTKFLSEFKDTEKTYIENHKIPNEILDNISNYKNCPFLNNGENNLKIIDFIENEDGSAVMKMLYVNGNEKDPKTYSTCSMLWLSDDEAFFNEKKVLSEKGFCEIRDSNLERHIKEGNIKNKNNLESVIVDKLCKMNKKIIDLINDDTNNLISVDNKKLLKNIK